MIILISGQNCVNHNFHPYIYIFFFQDVTWYLHGVDLVFTQYADDIFHVISNFHVQRSKLGGKTDEFGGKSEKSWTLHNSLNTLFPTLHQYSICSWLCQCSDQSNLSLLVNFGFNQEWWIHETQIFKKNWVLFLIHFTD